MEIKTDISLFKGNIAMVEGFDVIVNSTHEKLVLPLFFADKGSVNYAIHKSAGKSLRRECKTIGKCEVGSAVITSAYNLPCKKIIHTVGPVWNDDGAESFLLENCYYNVMELARKENLRSIAFPVISAGNHDYPKGIASRIAVETILYYCNEYPDAFDKICFVVSGSSLEREYELLLAENRIKPLDYISFQLEVEKVNIDNPVEQIKEKVRESSEMSSALKQGFFYAIDRVADGTFGEILVKLSRHKQFRKFGVKFINENLLKQMKFKVKDFRIKKNKNGNVGIMLDVEDFTYKEIILQIVDKIGSEKNELMELLKSIVQIAGDIISDEQIKMLIQRIFEEENERISTIIYDELWGNYGVELRINKIKMVI